MKTSAGILVYRKTPCIEYFLVRPGGPFYKQEDSIIWSIPKGVVEIGEKEEEAAKREFEEETGFTLRNRLFLLGETKLIKGKKIVIYGTESNFEANLLKSNFFEMEYPKNSGVTQKFPEIAEGKWFSYQEAQNKIFPKLSIFIEILNSKLIGVQE